MQTNESFSYLLGERIVGTIDGEGGIQGAHAFGTDNASTIHDRGFVGMALQSL